MPRHDVIIVGGGLSGLSCGIHLLDSSPDTDVMILDRLPEERFRRYHRMCGEALSSVTVKEMAPISLTGVRHTIDFTEECWPDGTVIRERIKGYVIDRPGFLLSMRRDFLSRGGSFMEGEVRDVRETDEGYTVSLAGDEFECDTLIGADGAFSRVRRCLYDERPRAFLPVKQYVVDRSMEEDVIRFVYDERYQGGYLWEFPCGDMMNMGFPKGCQEAPGDIVEENGRYIPLGALNRIAKGNSCLLGDAAGMVNPISFGGIRVALLSGKMAAKAIAAGDLRRYQIWWDRSPFSDPVYYDCYLTGMDWSNETMADFIHPFREGYGVIPFIKSYVGRPEFRTMTMSYYRSFKVGW